MTLGSIFGSVLGPSRSIFSELTGAGHSQKFLSERNSALYHHGYSKQHKGKSKSDKKHAILSALTLLAFLFFLSILQSCIREQNVNRGTVMMFGPTGGTGPTGHQAKDPGQESRATEGPSRSKRSPGQSVGDRTGHGRRSRVLLAVDEALGQEGRRQLKFIRNFAAVNNWTTELSQISERELQDQKLKTHDLHLFWKNKRLRETLPPTANKSNPQGLRRFKKRERTSSSTEPFHSTPNGPTWDYKRPDNFHPSPLIPQNPNNASHQNHTHTPLWHTKRDPTPTPHLTLNTPTITNPLNNYPSTTPRNRRSDYSTVTPPPHYDDYDTYTDPPRDDLHTSSPAPPIGLDLNTFQTFPVYNYHNHRPSILRDNQTTEPSTPQDIDRIHTQSPLFRPTNTYPPQHNHNPHRPTPPNSHSHTLTHSHLHTHPHPYSHPHTHPHPHTHTHTHPHPHPHSHTHHLKNRLPSDTSLYTFSPYRKTSSLYDPPHLHDHSHDHMHDHLHDHHDYHPPLVLAKYELQHHDPGFDLIKFLWTMLTSFAKPLTNLVPTFAKDNHQDTQCYDLLVCEAQRASTLMGPTAEALATTVGTLLTWAATEDTRQMVVDAINSGRENTCQQQIRDCEERSGGKSAMTVIAQVMEMKLR